jgi:hypothetical protein
MAAPPRQAPPPPRQFTGWPPPTLAAPPRQAPPAPRPIYREPTPVGFGMVLVSIIGGGLWMLLFGLLATTARGYAWASIVAGALALGIAALLARAGDRGAAVGVALSAAFGLAVATVVVIIKWAAGDWPLW